MLQLGYYYSVYLEVILGTYRRNLGSENLYRHKFRTKKNHSWIMEGESE